LGKKMNAAICSDCEFFGENIEGCPKCGAEMVVFENIGIRKDMHPTMPYEEPLRSFVLQIEEPNFRHFCQSYLKFYRKKEEKISGVFEKFVKKKPVSNKQTYADFITMHAVKRIDIDWFIQSACRKYYRHMKFLDQQVVSFIPQDIKKEQEIRDRKGWFVELGATGMFYYPPERIAFYDMDMDDKINNAVYSNKDDSLGISQYYIAHLWQMVTRNGVTSIEKTYLNDGNWYFGEAEYQGRKNGAKPWETEDKIQEHIGNDIKDALKREIKIYSKTKFGMYDIYVYGVQKEDEKIIEDVIEKYRRKYPKDTFTVFPRAEN
jgi:hypothetical protein